MEYRTIDELRAVAALHPDAETRAALTPEQRLRRWADVMETCDRSLRMLHGTEFEPPEVRDLMRSDNSPLSIAVADPALRSAGLKDDTYGEAKRFFGISDANLHWIVCDCGIGRHASARRVAMRIRRLAGPTGPGLVRRLWGAVTSTVARSTAG